MADLDANIAHLWLADTSHLLDSPRAQLLTDAEWRRAERYLDREKRELYLGGRIGLRVLLSAYTGIQNNDLAFTAGSRGKPRLANPLEAGELGFNYSLSRGRALYALAWNRQVGIDLELFPRPLRTDLLARRILDARERSVWEQVDTAGAHEALLSCWTRKEAYGKAIGVGIRYAMNRARVFVEVDSPAWTCRVDGLFEAHPEMPSGTTLQGLQLGLPAPGAAALVYDGDALDLRKSVRGWQLPAGSGEPV